MTLSDTDSSSFTLNIEAVNQDLDSDTNTSDTSSQTLTIDMPVLAVPAIDGPVDVSVLSSDVIGVEDSTVYLDLGYVEALDDAETISDVTVSGLPDGASLNLGLDNGDGSYRVAIADLHDLT